MNQKISPADGLRLGFEESGSGGYFPFPERFKVDEIQLANYMNGDIPTPRIPIPRIPGPNSAFEKLPSSKNSVPQAAPLRAQNPDLSRDGDTQESTTNGLVSNLFFKFAW